MLMSHVSSVLLVDPQGTIGTQRDTDKPQYEDPKTNHNQCQDIERQPSGARRPLCIWLLPETRQLSVLASENTHFIPQYDRPRELRVWNGILANILK